MSRLLFFALIGFVVYWLLKTYNKEVHKEDKPAQTEDMVRCAYCGIHLPRSECFTAEGNSYCSREHYLAHTKPAE
jgi:uncharacterized protein